MEDQLVNFIRDSLKDLKDDTGKILAKQDEHDQRFADGNIKFLELNTKIENVEKEKVSKKDFDPIKASVESRNKKEKGIVKTIAKFVTYAGLTGVGIWIEKTFG